MMNDNISRQAVLEAIQRHFNPTGKEMPTELASVLVGVGVVISTQPSTDRNGHWILTPMLPDNHRYECSNCKRHHRERYDFCPSCGADMRGGGL